MTNLIHDMGGMHGFGPVVPEPDEPVFHADWEERVYALQRAMGAIGLWTIDGGRASLENLPPLAYLSSSYYRRWFLGLERRVVTHGLVGEDEISAGRGLRPGIRLNRKLTADDAKTTSFPTQRRSEPARTRNGSMRWSSPAANCGARRPTLRSRCRSRPSSPISIRHEHRPSHRGGAGDPAQPRRSGVSRALGG